MEQNKFEQALKMVVRAKAFVYGQRMLEMVAKKQVFVVISCNDMGISVKKKVTDKTSFYNVPLIADLISVQELTNIIHHQTNIAAIGITDRNLAKLVLQAVDK